MNVDRILSTLNRNDVSFLLIGGMNFLLRHEPVSTYDVDIWIRNDEKNLARCERALAALGAEWGTSDKDWRPVGDRKHGWLTAQSVYCLTSPYGAIDVFRHVRGLEDWTKCNRRAVAGKTASGIRYRGLCDRDMLASQQALDSKERKSDRMRTLQDALTKKQR